MLVNLILKYYIVSFIQGTQICIKVEGEYASVATQNKSIVDENALKNDPGWMIPNDQISSAGFQIKYFLNGDKQFKTGNFDGSWTAPGVEKIVELNNLKNESISLVQTGPNLNSLPALNTTTPTVQTKGFEGSLKLNQKEIFKKTRPLVGSPFQILNGE